MDDPLRAPGSELEYTLRIDADDAERVADEIADLERLGPYPLIPSGARRIRDVYVDTEDRRLRGRRASLRVRHVGDDAWLTLKGAGKRLPAGGVDRPELELPWSPDALERVVARLEGYGVELPDATVGEPSGPLDALGRLSLRVVQDRSTLRRRSAVRRPRSSGGGDPSAGRDAPAADGSRRPNASADGGAPGDSPLAVLAVDRVEFRPGETGAGTPARDAVRTVVHHEVEIEARAPDGREHVGEVARLLRDRYGRVLVPWDRSKLSTGEALERLARRGALAELLTADGRLSPEGYALIEARDGDG